MKLPIVAGGLYEQVVTTAGHRCQCQGACGKRHLTPERKPGRCETIDTSCVAGAAPKLLAIPRDPTAPFHEAAALPAAGLIAFCRPCADGVRRIVNRTVKALPPQTDGLFDAEPYTAGRRPGLT